MRPMRQSRNKVRTPTTTIERFLGLVFFFTPEAKTLEYTI